MSMEVKKAVVAHLSGSTRRMAARTPCLRPLFYAMFAAGFISFVVLFLCRGFAAYLTTPACHSWLRNLNPGKCVIQSPPRANRFSATVKFREIESGPIEMLSKEDNSKNLNNNPALKAGIHDDDVDNLLYPGIYHNLTEFRRSYSLMEKTLRIYVYKNGHKPLVHQGPTSGIYASEGLFIDTMERGNEFTTEDPAQARLFFLPYSVKQMVTHLHNPSTKSMKAIKKLVKKYVQNVAAAHPYWNRTRGTDHFFVSCHDWAVRTLKDHQELNRNVIKVVCNADISNGFNLRKDVSMPEIAIKPCKLISDGSYKTLGGPEPPERPFLAFFAGQMHGTLRPEILKYWGNGTDSAMKFFKVGRSHPITFENNLSYIEYMKRSKYCVCPRGFDVNSPRLVEAIYYDCVPVVISNNYVFPFGEVLDWTKLAIRVAEKDVGRLKQILEDVPLGLYSSIQRNLKFARRHFLWHLKPVKYDVFNMIMHSLWIQTSSP